MLAICLRNSRVGVAERVESTNTSLMLATHSKRKTSQPVSSTWIRSCPGVTVSLNVFPKPDDLLSPTIPAYSPGICSKIEHNGYEVELRVLNIECDAFAERILRRGLSESASTTSLSSYGSSSLPRTRSHSFGKYRNGDGSIQRISRRRFIASPPVPIDFLPHIAPAEGYVDESESKLAANGLTHRDAVDLILKNGNKS
jgi:hypothetical protein